MLLQMGRICILNKNPGDWVRIIIGVRENPALTQETKQPCVGKVILFSLVSIYRWINLSSKGWAKWPTVSELVNVRTEIPTHLTTDCTAI